MRNLLLLMHLAAAIFWMGGMGFMLFALRPPLTAQLLPPGRLALAVAVMRRFFVMVGISIAVLLGSGAYLWLGAPRGDAPPGWHAMAGLGVAMALIFGHLFFGPWRRMKTAVEAESWPDAGKSMGQVALLVKINFVLGWIAIAAVVLWQ